MRHFELVVPSFIPAVREAGHIFTLDPDFWTTESLGKPWHFFQRGWQMCDVHPRKLVDLGLKFVGREMLCHGAGCQWHFFYVLADLG